MLPDHALGRGRPLDSSTEPDNDTPKLLKAALNIVVADEQHLDGPEDLAHGTTAHTGLCLHTDVRMPGPLAINRPLKSCYPSPHQCPDGVPPIHPSASLCARATYSGRP